METDDVAVLLDPDHRDQDDLAGDRVDLADALDVGDRLCNLGHWGDVGLHEIDGFDARGTLGLDREPYRSASVRSPELAELDADAEEGQLLRLAASTGRYWVVGQSLAAPPRFVMHATEPTH